MKRPLFMIWAAIRWVPLMFLIAPVMEAPLTAYKSEPAKPIKTWVGNASWYGAEFNGRKTADGERFDCESLTAAHPNLRPYRGFRYFVPARLPPQPHVRVYHAAGEPPYRTV